MHTDTSSHTSLIAVEGLVLTKPSVVGRRRLHAWQAKCDKYFTCYAFRGDLDLPGCKAKCEELQCGCFDFTDSGKQRTNEKCR